MLKIKKNIVSVNFCKYSKFMNDSSDPHKENPKTVENAKFAESGIFVKEDDQDWGSSGMNDIQKESE